MWKADRRTIQERLLLFAPVSWLLYQFQYYSLLDWPMSSLQNIAVILFSLLAIYLLSRNETRSFYLSLLSLVLAICSSGNGFFVIPIGCLMLFQFRSFPRLVIWTAASMTMVALYFGKYDYLQSQAHADHSVLSSIHHLSPLYALSFLGSSIASYSSYIPAAALGVCLCVVFLFAIVDRFYSKNPAMFYSICFLLITAIAVSGLRSDFGISQSLVSRYRIYSNLALIFTYLYLVGRFQSRVTGPMIRRFALVAIMVAAVGFNLGSTYAGFKLLRIRTDLTVEGIRRWEHGEESITTAAGPANEDAVIKRQRLHGNYQPSDFELRQAGSLNVYIPPAL
jgi:hypothetical protein